MARIFNIYFEYNYEACSAVVMVRTTPFHTEYTLSSVDGSLQHFLPTNKIIFTPSGGYAFLNTPSTQHNSLMNEILKAMSSHLQSFEV
ncbi:MAG: hypothetical protein H0U44_05995 [Flavisolibacter sp.]|jgi:hypothetical protein|nr:hypothetical protein [Flavisolibacter sp.]